MLAFRQLPVLSLALALLHGGLSAARAAPALDASGCLSFVGDISLSRRIAEVADQPALWAELWRGLQPDLPPSAPPMTSQTERWLVGNLEGALFPESAGAASPCRSPLGICLPILPRHLDRLATSPFVALGLENNHSQDYGGAARATLQARLRELGIAPLSDDESTPFTLLQRGQRRWALLALNLINRSADEVDAALLRLRLRLGLARAHTPWVVLLVHWGREYDPQPGPVESKLGQLFAAWGARLVVGAHPHVVGGASCQPDFAQYYSLGNLLFDQPMPATHQGWLLRCCPQTPDQLDCRTFRTQRRAASPTAPLLGLLPQLAGEASEQRCQLRRSATSPPSSSIGQPGEQQVDSAWQRHPQRAALLFVQPFRSLGQQHYFALRRLYSTFDNEVALRPYVFALKGERTVDVWRGTALSWPLLYARLLTAPDGRELLCALHRGDSYVHRNPQVARQKRFHAVYAWTGFGFRQVEDAAGLSECQKL